MAYLYKRMRKVAEAAAAKERTRLDTRRARVDAPPASAPASPPEAPKEPPADRKQSA